MIKKGQVSIFVIVAIVLVAGIVVFFAVRGGLFTQSVPAEFRPIYSVYSECITQETENAVALLGAQGGRISADDYVPGSDYAPFSSHLNFLGIPVPYWYYVAGNNIVQENVPTTLEMEEAISTYIAEGLSNCDFSDFYQQGFFITLPETVSVSTTIEPDKVVVDVSSILSTSREGSSASKSTHEVEVASKLGSLHSTALSIYDKQVTETFLEYYAVDVLRTYAPVDGVEVQCAPTVWKTRDVIDELKTGLASNFAAIKFSGNYYTLNEQEDEYFVVDLSVSESVNLLYSEAWPTGIEISPADQDLLIAEPVGNQEGLGVLGFCYVPYHFVYDVRFPVMVQISEGTELFQFPLAVIIDNNQPREAELLSVDIPERPDVCEFMENDLTVSTFDANLNPVEATVKYQCFDQVCDLGKTAISEGSSQAILATKAPACYNGQLIVESEGYANSKQLFSTNSETFADVILDREHDIIVELRVDGSTSSDTAVITIKGEDTTRSAALPDSNTISLTEGQYDITAFVYGDSNIVIPATSRTQCYEVSAGGLFGLFGSTKEECVTIDVPSTTLENALIGGGTTSIYLLESELAGGRIVIDIDSLPKPSSLEELQYNYQSFDTSTIGVSFI